ncbi:MAG: hypothetical protein M0Z55_10180 [Peptococcaceae bacterium]|nr:hypothetical protein [Peptococcaceae bacterium]
MEIWGKTEDYLEDLLAIEPVYHSEFGDSCKLYLRQNRWVWDKRSIRGVKRALIRGKALNQVLLRKLCSQQLGRELSLPIPLSASLILVPLKMRQPFTGNDSAYGLVNSRGVRKIVDATGGGCVVLLDPGMELGVVSGRETVLAHLAEGELIHKYFVQTVWGLSNSE